MIHADILQLQADLPQYLKQVAEGETIVICKDDQPFAEIKPVPPAQKQPRPMGLGVGLITLHPNCFDPLPPDILAAFYGEQEP